MNATATRHEPLESVQPWREAILALPFACLCALGWMTWLPVWAALIAAFAPFVARRFVRSVPYAPWFSVYAAIPALLTGGDLLSRLGAFFAALALAYLIGAALDGVRDGTAWAWIAPGMIFALWPGPWSALGGLGLGVLGALENRRWRARGQLGHVRPEGIVALGLVAIAVAVLTLGLGKPSGWNLDQSSSPNPRVRTPENTAPKPGVSGRSSRRPALIPPETSGQSALVNISLQLVLVVMVLVIGLAILRMRLEKPRGARGSWLDLIPIVGMIVLVLAILAWSLLSRKDGSGEPGSVLGGGSVSGNAAQDANTQKNTVQDAKKPSSDPIWPTFVMLAVAVAAGAYFLYLARRAPEMPTEYPDLDSAPDAHPNLVQATNRVREAYRVFLSLGARAGIPKVASETPQEFAARVAERHPSASGPSSRLTGLYEPVRYGQLADASGALEAETALRDLHGILGDDHPEYERGKA